MTITPPGPLTKKEPAPTTETGPQHSHPTTDVPETTGTCRRCAIDEPCRCAFYAMWRLKSATPAERVAVQLRRRREAALRCPRLPSGLRDPYSASTR